MIEQKQPLIKKPLKDAIQAFTENLVLHSFIEQGLNRRKTAEYLDIHYSQLLRLLKRIKSNQPNCCL